MTNFLPVTKNKKNLIFLGIVFVQFTFLAWQRDFYVGQDTYQYYEAYKYYSRLSFLELGDSSWEPGYKIINYLCSNIGINYHYFLLIINGFTFYSFLRFVYCYSDNVWISVLTYIAFGYYFGAIHLLRQSVAISFILYSYKYILERRFRPFVIYVIIATLFHYSAILFVCTYYINKVKKINPQHLIFLFTIFACLTFVLGNSLLSLLIFSASDGNRFSYVDRYMTDEASGSGYSMLILMTAIMGAGFLIKPRNIGKKIKMFYLIYFIAWCFQPLATIISMFSRATLYWSISVTIFIPMLIKLIKNYYIRLLIYTILIGGLIIFFIKFTNAAEGNEIWGTYRWYDGE